MQVSVNMIRCTSRKEGGEIENVIIEDENNSKASAQEGLALSIAKERIRGRREGKGVWPHLFYYEKLLKPFLEN